MPILSFNYERINGVGKNQNYYMQICMATSFFVFDS